LNGVVDRVIAITKIGRKGGALLETDISVLCGMTDNVNENRLKKKPPRPIGAIGDCLTKTISQVIKVSQIAIFQQS
jgi:hypothetical protein